MVVLECKLDIVFNWKNKKKIKKNGNFQINPVFDKINHDFCFRILIQKRITIDNRSFH